MRKAVFASLVVMVCLWTSGVQAQVVNGQAATLAKTLFRHCDANEILAKDDTQPYGVKCEDAADLGSAILAPSDTIDITEDPADTFTFAIPTTATPQVAGIGLGTPGEADYLVLGAGNIKSPDAAIGVSINIQAGGGISAAGGNAGLTAGGGATTGGAIYVSAGNGDVTGGAISLTAGNGSTGGVGGSWTGVAGTGLDGHGGDWLGAGGDANESGHHGGNTYLRPGLGNSPAVNGNIIVDVLPTADPMLSGAVWNNGNVLVRSGDTLPQVTGLGIGTPGVSGKLNIGDDGIGTPLFIFDTSFNRFTDGGLTWSLAAGGNLLFGNLSTGEGTTFQPGGISVASNDNSLTLSLAGNGPYTQLTASFGDLYLQSFADTELQIIDNVGNVLFNTIYADDGSWTFPSSVSASAYTVTGLSTPTNKPVCFDANGTLYAGTNTMGVLTCP